MKILFVCHRLPYPPNRGGKIRPFNMIRHLGQKHSVTVASLAFTEDELKESSELKNYCADVITEVVPNSVRWRRACRALLTATPSSVAYFWSPHLRRRVEEAARHKDFDAVLVHCAFAAQYAVGIPTKFGMLDFGDLDSAKWFDYEKERAFPLSRVFGIEARKLRKYEKKVAQKFQHCTLTTYGELEEFKKLKLGLPSSVIPNGVDSSYFQHSQQRGGDAPIIVFLGRMDYFPNIDGVLYFAKEIFPLIRRKIPRAEFHIVGSKPSRAIKKLQAMTGISVTGHVPDVRPYLHDAAVSIAPLRMARGTQNKILESMAMGVPVVATPQAAKGIQAIPQKHLLVGDDAESFADQVVRVLENPTLQKLLSEAGRKRVEETHAWSVSMQILDGILQKAVTATGGSAVQGLAASIPGLAH